MKKAVVLLVLFCMLFPKFNIADEPKDKGVFIDYKNEFYEEIKNKLDEYYKKPEEKKKRFFLNVEGYDLPKSVNEFTSFWHNEPISQGFTGTCWSFSTTSFFESEVYRLTKKKVKLSEMYTVYWEYVEKVRRFVRERGNSFVGEGSEANAVVRIWKEYGCVPATAYSGMKEGQPFYDHRQLFSEIKSFLDYVKQNSVWNEDYVIATVKEILNHYMGVPPQNFMYEGKKYTPIQFLNEYLKLNLNEYVDFYSIMEEPYYEKVLFDVPDNWWKSKDYHNVPLDEFMQAIVKAIRNGYTIAIGGDVSEAGIVPSKDVAMVPDFDIPSAYINEYARQFRFSNRTTEDDHGVHLVGYKEHNGQYWFLIKDSGASARLGENKGYYFYSWDFIKLKMLTFMVHRSAVEDLLKKFK